MAHNLSSRAVNNAMMHFDLYQVQTGYSATPEELQCMDACLSDLTKRQATYAAGAAVTTMIATQISMPFRAPFNRLPVGARLIATAGAAYFAADTAVLHSSRTFLARITSLPSSPLGAHLRAKCAIPAPAVQPASTLQPMSTLRRLHTQRSVGASEFLSASSLEKLR
eukprot:CAMPEP_0185541634 /NCGR_PEP_ID=MMETSP1381-20130426/2096_1 /TAXON_ID=298111 /ORGANISM="Pavlova sp., Strain CCMP459" /LENGTH=166 /DNA_ID=CAMNT_0028153553 /DNA_START=26 /DNA_END=526 /DNA_ORIENTATION=+